jgi:hypothetical protein
VTIQIAPMPKLLQAWRLTIDDPPADVPPVIIVRLDGGALPFWVDVPNHPIGDWSGAYGFSKLIMTTLAAYAAGALTHDAAAVRIGEALAVWSARRTAA